MGKLTRRIRTMLKNLGNTRINIPKIKLMSKTKKREKTLKFYSSRKHQKSDQPQPVLDIEFPEEIVVKHEPETLSAQVRKENLREEEKQMTEVRKKSKQRKEREKKRIATLLAEEQAAITQYRDEPPKEPSPMPSPACNNRSCVVSGGTLRKH